MPTVLRLQAFLISGFLSIASPLKPLTGREPELDDPGTSYVLAQQDLGIWRGTRTGSATSLGSNPSASTVVR